MNHIGWHTKESALYYSRVEKFRDATVVADKLSRSVRTSIEIESKFRENDEANLATAFL